MVLWFSFHWGMNEKTDVHIVWRAYETITSLKWNDYLNETNKSTVNYYNLILNHFHAKRKGKQLWNKTKFKLIQKRKNELTNAHGGMIIQFWAALKESEMSKYRLFKLFSFVYIIAIFMHFSSLIHMLTIT